MARQANRPTLEIRFLQGAADRPPKTLRCLTPAKLSRYRARAIRFPHMISAVREICARSFLCELPALGLIWSMVLTSFRRCFVRPTNSLCRLWTASPMREAPPLALPASLLARGLTARFFSLTALWFYRGFIGRLGLLKRLAFGHANNYEL